MKSLEEKLEEFFKAQPDEWLTANDIAVKFEVLPETVWVVSKRMVQDGRLKREPYRGKTFVYTSRGMYGQ